MPTAVRSPRRSSVLPGFSGYAERQAQLPPRATHSRVSVVSLEIPGIVVSLEIPVFRIFLVKNFRKIVKISFLDSRDQNRILKCSWFFLYDQYLCKKTKKSPRIAFWPKILFSDQIKHAVGQILMQICPMGAIFSPSPPPGSPFFDQCFLDFAILGSFKS